MQLLLDTHIFLWFIAGNPLLSAYARSLIEDLNNDRFLSMASVWEMAIKVSTGKITLAQPLEQLIPYQVQRNKITLLPVELSHVVQVSKMPFHHRDPFDRLIIAQGLTEAMPVISVDAIFDPNGVQRFS